MVYIVEDIKDKWDRLTSKQEDVLVTHANEYGIPPEICAWYDDMEDFYVDWIQFNKIYETREGAYERYKEGKFEGEFLEFSDGQIVRLVL